MVSKFDPEIKRNILLRRKELKISQAEMAQRLNVDRNTYRYIESGKTALVSGYLDRIAEILDVPAEQLLIGFNPYNIDSDPRLEEFKVEFGRKHRDEEQHYLEEIARLKGIIDDQKEKIALLQDLTHSTDLIIEYLKSKNQDIA